MLYWSIEREYLQWWIKILYFHLLIVILAFGESHTRDMIPNVCGKNLKFSQSVKVWGCTSTTGVGKICFLKILITAAVYQDVLDHFLFPYIWDNEYMFQYDLAPSHPAKITKEWFKEKRIPVLDWPANSPDEIENLGGILKRQLRKYYPSNVEELKLVIHEVWMSVSPETCDLIGSLPKQMKEMVNTKGSTAKY